MSHIEESIDVGVATPTVYDQWTQFEEFPRFMEGVDRVVQLDDTTLEWTASIAGVTKSWRARIVDQVPDRRVSWVADEGARNDGVVTFQPLGADRTRVNLALTVEPDGPLESAGDALGVVKARVHGDLERFRDFIERRGVETGAWRGEVEAGRPAGAGADRAWFRDEPFDAARAGDAVLPGVRARSEHAAARDLGPGPGAGGGFAEGETSLPDLGLGGGIGAGGGFAEGSTSLTDAELAPGPGAGAGFAVGATSLPDAALGPGPGAGGGFAEGETEADLAAGEAVDPDRDDDLYRHDAEAYRRDLAATRPGDRVSRP